MNVAQLLIGNDTEIVIEALRLTADGSYVNDAVLTAAVTADGVAVTGASSISLEYQSGSNGNYRGIIPGTVSLTAGADYVITVTSSNYNLRWVITRTAAERTG